MSDKIDTSAVGNPPNPASAVAEGEGKGKGKAVDIDPKDVSMDEDEEDSDDEETGAEDDVCLPNYCAIASPAKSNSRGFGTLQVADIHRDRRRLNNVR